MSELTLLGTSSMVPTKQRNVQSFYLEYDGEGILIDCGEGTQRQMNICGVNRNKIRKILISHWHGDHVAGLIGLLQTVGHQLGQDYDDVKNEKVQLHLYGPPGTKEKMHHMLRCTQQEQGKVDINVHELEMKSQKIYENDKYELHCAPLRHSTPCLGYSFVEKDTRKMEMDKAAKFGLKGGRKIGQLQRGETVEHNGQEITPDMVSYIKKGKKLAVVADTGVCNEAVNLAEDADVLIIEATYCKEHEEKAIKFKHLTSEQAAGIAQQAGVKKLILTHFSQRYTNLDAHLNEAKTLHDDTVLGYDFMRIDL